MYESKTINFKRKDGPITMEIISGYATLGSYSIIYCSNGETIPIGSGKLTDNIPDVYFLPLNFKETNDCTIYIIGNYLSAPGQDQINVSYVFLQKGVVLKGESPVEIQILQSVISTHHSISFNMV